MVTRYFYDGLDNLLCVEQHGNVSGAGCGSPPSSDATSPWRVRRFSYDSLSRLLTATNPETGTINYTYDFNGNLISKTSPAPNAQPPSSATQTISYCYDALNRMTAKFYSANPNCASGTPDAGYIYDLSQLGGASPQNPVGRLVAEYSTLPNVSGLVSSITSYDAMGRIAWQGQVNQRVTPSVTEGFMYVYNPDGSVQSITYPSTRKVTYTYNAAQRPTSAVDNNGISFAANAHYTPFGALSSLANGATSSFAGITNTDLYSARIQPCRMTATSTGVVPSSCTDSTTTGNVLDLGYNFVSCNSNGANNGNVCGVVNGKNSTRSQAFQYDALNRLTQALTPNSPLWGTTYTYDAWGNLYQKTTMSGKGQGDLAMTGITATVKNQLTGMNYDVAGNFLGLTALGNTNTYDAENRLRVYSNLAFDYDAEGRRVQKSDGTLYWYGPSDEVLDETDLSGNLKNEYVFFGGKRTARMDSSGVHYYFADHLGSADVVTNATGSAIEEESDFYPFGGELVVTGPGPNHYKFTGKERDSETGCDYFGARYYCNPIGRFITPDWAAKPTTVPYANFGNPQSLNLYSYVKNNPTTFGDPDGHCFEDLCIIELTIAFVGYEAITSPPAIRAYQQAGRGINQAINDISSHFHPSTSLPTSTPSSTGTQVQTSTPPSTGTHVQTGTPGSTGTQVQTGTPASTSQQGVVNTSPAESRLFPKDVKSDTRDNAGGRCEYCGVQTVPAQKSQAGVPTPPNQGQTDHYDPYSVTQDSSAVNAVHACASCNNAKSDTQPQGTQWELPRMKKADPQ